MKKRKEPNIRIRRATLRDLDTLVDQRHKMWHDIRRFPLKKLMIADEVYRKWVTTMTRRGRFVGFLAVTQEGEVVAGGCVWVKEVHPSPWSSKLTTPYLLSMYTNPSFRGRGLATRIVKEAMNWCKMKGFSNLSLHASDMGKNVYTKLGFEQTREMRIRFARR